uniref:RNA polymerase II associated protein 1 n=1 Tax=Amazona collaria TaxID=241587 RepID=A0A8B9EWB5_9PSIT
MMLSRPKPGESEADLLHFQNQFLAARASPAVKVVKKADKRKGEGKTTDAEGPPLQDSKDVVMLDDFPDTLPALTPAPPKKSKIKSACVHFEDEDPEERLESHDRHITAVFSKIIERDTSAAAVTIPVPTGDPFPRTFHRSEIKSEVRLGAASSWCRHIKSLTAFSADLTDEVGDFLTSQQPCLITGEGLGSQKREEEVQAIHKENLEKLQSMSEEEILQEQERLLAQLDPTLVAFLKSRRGGNEGQKKELKMEQNRQEEFVESLPVAQHDVRSCLSIGNSIIFIPALEGKTAIFSPHKDDDLPVKPKKEWIHMDNVEFEKLEWMKDLPLPQQKKTKKGMQARFSLKGELIPADADLPTHLGLHHHGEEAERAGYSLQELFHLSRSQVIQQRTLALQVLGRIVQKARAGEFVSSLKGSILRLLLDAGFLFLLRFSVDDAVDNVMAAAVGALRALLVSLDDEEYLDWTFSWYQGMAAFPFVRSNEEEEEEEEDEELNGTEKSQDKKLKDENKPDPDVARYDVVKGLLKTRIQHRLRYILEVVRPVPAAVLDILHILTHIARHSSEACSQLLDCPRLIETIVREFLPTQWDPQVAEPGCLLTSLHGVACATAMKFIRVLACGGRNATARLLNKFEMKSRLSRFIAEDPVDLLLPREEAIRLSTEAFRLWAVAAAYGQACDLYRDLYPVLVRILQSLPELLSTCSEKSCMTELAVQRATAVVTLLIHVTQTAGYAAELQAKLKWFLSALFPVQAGACPDYSQHASLHHCVAMALLSRLLPGSEHLAYEVLLDLAFNPEFLPEGKAGGPEAADFSDILHLGTSATRGALLRESYQDLPSIHSCYLSHFVHLQPTLMRSQASYQGRNYLIQSMLLPEVKGPILPSDWPFFPLISLYNRVTNAETRGAVLNSLPLDLVNTVTWNLQWVLLLETWRAKTLQSIPTAAKLARLMCVFLTGSDLFLEAPIHRYTAALLSVYCQPKALDSLNLDAPLPGLASFHDLYISLLEQFEAVSFGDPLFGVFVLLPLQKRFSVHLRLSVFGEHTSILKALGVPLQQFPVPLERYTSPPEDNLNLLRLYFRTLVSGTLRHNWCPVLYVVAVAHVNSFIFSQDSTTRETDAARKSMLRKTWLLVDETLKKHLLYYRLSNAESPLGFDLYEQLPPMRLKYLQVVKNGGARFVLH